MRRSIRWSRRCARVAHERSASCRARAAVRRLRRGALRDCDVVVHGRAASRADCRRCRGRRRSGDDVVHVAGHGQRDPARGRTAGLCRCRSGDAQHRPRGDRARDHPPNECHHAGAFRRCTLRHGRDRGNRPDTRAEADRGRGPRGGSGGGQPKDRLDRRLHLLFAVCDQEPCRRRGRVDHHRLRAGGKAASAAALPGDLP